MDKRSFIKTLGLAALGTPFLGAEIPEWAAQVKRSSIMSLSADEDFWKAVRKDYKLKPDYINLESGYYNIIPTPTLNHFIEHAKMVNYHGSYYMRTVQWDNKKRMAKKLADLVGCSSKNMIITRNTTESLDMVIAGFPWVEGDEAVYALQDYGAMQLMFEQVSKRHGIVLRKVSVPNHPKSDEEIVALYENAITDKTKLLMVCHMINITGQLLPVKKICEMAHKHGVQVMVDGAHCVGQIAVDITDLGCDYYGASLHKWLAVPLGVGMLYVHDNQIDTIWPLLAGSAKEPGDITRLNHTGTHPVYHDLTIENAIDYYNYLGAERKEARLRYLQEYWTSKVKAHPRIELNTPTGSDRSCAIANVGIQGMEPRDMAKQLMDDYKIFTVAINRPGVKGCRITPNVFNLTSELDALVKALKTMAEV